MSFGRLLTAMVTAFDVEGKLDLKRQTKVIEHLIQTGTETIVVAGTTGESPTLTKDEKLTLFEHTLEVTDGRVKVIAGTGSNNTQESIALTQKAEQLGVDGVMLVTPYYNRPNQEGLYQHFKAIAESTSLPVMLYNVPGRTSVNMEAETVCRLAEIPNITMVKEASGHLGQMTEIIKGTPDDFLLYSGDDNLTLPVLAIGGYGVVSVASHVVGREMSRMISAFVEGNVSEAAQIHGELYPKCKALFAAPSPVPVKQVLTELGIDVGPVRPPLVPLSESEKTHIMNYFK
ncbi:4-hydroxy-tetrahydrodipicolinate synthase [Caldalkalibacillus thermarum]|uniref:4-hydroxy-tetrahydrodipicolinate synthase n=1 Tax=Caldalkalibacillus thermarum TaxID=296745 RepID=UPI0019A65D3F|nr:4-hydroxy-tetrahydrodipicolinate synthase [Caldalkalibacillus thermarum]GGK13290.1 4-hydroxy-tetrahydrodipicolinate synthase [Caldalkalibacillus thermarum]